MFRRIIGLSSSLLVTKAETRCVNLLAQLQCNEADEIFVSFKVVNLHYLLSQARVSARPSVLWCYKKDLGFTTHRKKREAKIKRDVKRGIREPNEQNPFEIFVTVTDIRYTCVFFKQFPRLFDIFGISMIDITRSLIKSWAIPMACASYKTLKLSHQIYWRGLLRQWRVVV